MDHRKIIKKAVTHDVVSYVTSFVVFNTFPYTFFMFCQTLSTTFCKATVLGFIQKSPAYILFFCCNCMVLRNIQLQQKNLTMWSVTLRLLWFLTDFRSIITALYVPGLNVILSGNCTRFHPKEPSNTLSTLLIVVSIRTRQSAK